MHLTILTPEKTVFTGDADSLRLPGSLGLMGILNNHAPIVSGMVPGVLHFKSQGNDQLFFISNGFFEFSDNSATILADAAETPGDIDLERAKKAEKRAQDRLRKKQNVDFDRAQRALLRSIFRQKTRKLFS